jgi:predicted dehydrogenase
MTARRVFTRKAGLIFAGMLTQFVAGATEVKFITLDPGHFHAALVQKFMYPGVDPLVHVYAPPGEDLDAHLKRIQDFNSRADTPTHWQEKVYTGRDFLPRMLREKQGNVVVIAGNNTRKTEYIDRSIQAGLDVLADKPMAINPEQFQLLRKTFATAEKKKLLLFDIMTERFEIATILQRELAREPAVFGTLESGTAESPAVVMESVHHFFKEVAGQPLIRSAWFFDVRQEGEAIPDVGSHLIDLVQWECFPGQSLDWRKDLKLSKARRWPTVLSQAQFKRATGLEAYPDFLRKDSNPDGSLNVFGNGEVSYTIRGVQAKVTARWNFEAPPGVKDTHYSSLRGTGASLVIRQGAPENFVPVLYIEKNNSISSEAFERNLKSAVTKLAEKWPGLAVETFGKSWKLVIPEKYHVGHEEHFKQVTELFLRYWKARKLPAEEVPNMLCKYYTTTEAFRLSHER